MSRRTKRLKEEPARRLPVYLWPVIPLFFLLIAGLLLVLSPILVPVLAAKLVGAQCFRWRWAGHYFIVASRRRGWFDFVSNNVVPVLPPNVSVIWDRKERQAKHVPRLIRLLRGRQSGVPRPYLVKVSAWRMSIVRLHSELQPLKLTLRRNETTQLAVARAVHEHLRGV